MQKESLPARRLHSHNTYRQHIKGDVEMTMKHRGMSRKVMSQESRS